MIPAFDPTTGALPPGVHEATWGEVAERFGAGERRRALLAGMRDALRTLGRAGCTRVYLGGSFVTAIAEPGDWDGCYDRNGVHTLRLDTHIAASDRTFMKMLYLGEIYDADDMTITGEPFRAFFQRNRAGDAVGVVALDPATIG